jgi:hypothetical protein
LGVKPGTTLRFSQDPRWICGSNEFLGEILGVSLTTDGAVDV